MRYTNNNTTEMFYEQVQTVTELFKKWSECQRTVAICALLKELEYPCLKFIQSTIEVSFAQCDNHEQIKRWESQANNKSFLTDLCDSYTHLTTCSTGNDVQLNQDSMFYNEFERNPSAENVNNNNNFTSHNNNLNNVDKCNKKEDILIKILYYYLPMLRIGNHEAKSVYLSLIPSMVKDLESGRVSTPTAQQILSYLLMHPALTTEDRRSLDRYKRYMENYIVHSEPVNNSWQTIAPPAVLQSSLSLSSTASSQKINLRSTENLWDSQSIHVSQDYLDGDCASSNNSDFMKTIGQHIGNNSVVGGVAVGVGSVGVSVSGVSIQPEPLFETSTDDHHVSFSKNGTEIIDFDADSDKSNTQIAFDASTTLNDFLAVPMMINDQVPTKTRRSNSLTIGTRHHEQSSTFASSNENLYNMIHKQRSLSLSMESPRSSVTSSGSETRLDDFKAFHGTYETRHVGMKNLATWLKDLRLHKYVWLLAPLTYDQMLEITEEYLCRLNVTKGARTKIVLCIQKLKARFVMLKDIERDLRKSLITIGQAVEELANIINTPMKPVDITNPEDVATQFLVVLNLVIGYLTTKQFTMQDEKVVDAMFIMLKAAKRCEAFEASIGYLEDHEATLKIKFPTKGHSNKNCGSLNGLNSNKLKCNSAWKSHKTGSNSNGPNGCDKKKYRKNSNPFPNFKPSRGGHTSIGSSYHSGSSSSQITYSKSSSYPNFSCGSNMGGPQQNYHRHSASNLITITPSHTTASITTPSASMSQQHENASSTGLFSSTNKLKCSTTFPNGSHTTTSMANAARVQHNCQRSSSSGAENTSSTFRQYATLKNNIGDINSGLDFLCLQMAEHAIN